MISHQLLNITRLKESRQRCVKTNKAIIGITVGIGISLLSTSINAKTLTLEEMGNQAYIPIEQAQQAPLLHQKLPNLDISKQGKKSLSDFNGKVILLDFWASWCGPCRASFPWMNKVMNRYQDKGFEVVAINLDQEANLAQAFLNQVPANFTVLQDEMAVMPEAYGLIGMPSSYLIDKKGRLRAVHIGFHNSKVKDYESAIIELLDEKED